MHTRVLTQAQIAKRDQRRANFKAIVEMFKNLTADQLQELAPFLISNPDGHTLSFGNTILINLQREGCTIVGGYQQWKQHNRHVKKGECGISIWYPSNLPKNEDDEIPDRIQFLSTTVFDISQTEETIN